ncbi:MAG: hypothetical protein AAF449_01315 [Myxococcota bacterium]
MSGLLSRFVDVRAGEGLLVLRTTATLAGLIGAHTMLETARDALFLGKLAPSSLTFVYALLAGLALIASQANSAFVRRFGRRNALVFTLLGSAYGTVIIYLLPRSPEVVFGLYLWSGLLGSVIVVQFWMLAGTLFTVAQGKRLFGLLASGGVLGAVVGAGAAAISLRYIEVQHLLVVGSAVFLLTAIVVTTIETDPLPDLAASQSSKSLLPQLLAGFNDFRQNTYLLRLAVLVGVSTGAVLVTDYLFKSMAARTMTPEELGPFFAVYYSVLNSVALLAQVIVVGALVRRTGVLAAFCVLPTLLLAGGTGLLLLGGSFVTVLLIKGADGSLRHSLHRIASELLWMPLPDETRTDSKAFIDTVVVRGAQAVVAAGLLALATFNLDRSEILAGIIVGLCGLWLLLGYQMRRPYLDLFRRALNGDGRDTMRGALNLNIESVAVVVEALSSRDEDRAIAAIDLLEANQQHQVIPALILYHEAPAVLIRALEVIALPARKDWIPLAERLLEHAQPEVRTAALRALAQNGDLSAVERRLLDIDPSVRAQAAFWLARSEEGPPEKHEAIRFIVDMNRMATKRAYVSLLKAIATAGDRRWVPVILELCELTDGTTDPDITVAIASAIRKVGDERFIPLLISRLRFRAGRTAVREAIVDLGTPALDALEKELRDTNLSRRIRRHIPRTIARFTEQRAADILVERLSVERSGLVRYKILKGLRWMVSETTVLVDQRRIEDHLHRTLVEYLRLLSMCTPVRTAVKTASEDDSVSVRSAANSGGLLIGLLEDKLAQALDRAFCYLNLVHRSEDLRSVSVASQSSDRRLRAQALEYLDALTLDATVSEIRTLLRLIVDDLPDDERIQRAAAFLPDPPRGYHEALSRLLRDPDDAVASIAAYHALMLRASGLTSDVLSLSEERPTLSDLQKIVDHLSQSDEVPSVA